MTISIENKICGLLFGLAAGDQIGGPIRMALQLSNSLLDSNRFDEKSVLRHYYTWWNEAGFDTGYVAHNVFQKMKQYKLNREAVDEVHRLTGGKTGGCNPMHRATPIVLLQSANQQQLAQYTLTEAKLTHYDRIAGECSRFVILTCRQLLDGSTLQDALYASYEASSDSPKLISKLADVVHLSSDKSKLDKPLSDGGYSPEVLRSAIYFLQTHSSFEATLSSAITFAGASNYCPVVVGAIAGVQYGYQTIPDHFIKHPSLIHDLNNIAYKFIERWEQST